MIDHTGIVVSDFEKSNEAKLKEVVSLFLYGKSKIVYIVGARNSGKTATAFMFAETTHKETGRLIYYVAPTVGKEALPEWCKSIDSIKNVPNGSLAMIDEAALQYNAREFYDRENIDMTKLLAIARHKDLFLIFITQDTALADTNIKRLRDVILWKRANNYTMSEKGDRFSREQKFWQKVRNMMAPRTQDECLFEYPAQKRFINFKHGLPDCWTDDLSKIWGDRTFEKPIIAESIPIKLKKEVLIVK